MTEAEYELTRIKILLDDLQRKVGVGHSMASGPVSRVSMADTLADMVATLIAERDEANMQYEHGGRAIAENTKLRTALEKIKLRLGCVPIGHPVNIGDVYYIADAALRGRQG